MHLNLRKSIKKNKRDEIPLKMIRKIREMKFP